MICHSFSVRPQTSRTTKFHLWHLLVYEQLYWTKLGTILCSLFLQVWNLGLLSHSYVGNVSLTLTILQVLILAFSNKLHILWYRPTLIYLLLLFSINGKFKLEVQVNCTIHRPLQSLIFGSANGASYQTNEY